MMNKKELESKIQGCLQALEQELTESEEKAARGGWSHTIHKTLLDLGALSRMSDLEEIDQICALMSKIADSVRVDDRSIALLKHGKKLAEELLKHPEGEGVDVKGYITDIPAAQPTHPNARIRCRARLSYRRPQAHPPASG